MNTKTNAECVVTVFHVHTVKVTTSYQIAVTLLYFGYVIDLTSYTIRLYVVFVIPGTTLYCICNFRVGMLYFKIF